MTGSAPSPDDASHRRENHEARGPSFETALRASSGRGRWVCLRSEQNSSGSGSPPRSL